MGGVVIVPLLKRAGMLRYDNTSSSGKAQQFGELWRTMTPPRPATRAPRGDSMLTRLECVDFAHEWRSDVGVQLDVEQHRPVRLLQQWLGILQVLQRADGPRLEPEGSGDGREIDVGEHGLLL